MSKRTYVEYSYFARTKPTSNAILFTYDSFEGFLLDDNEVLGDIGALIQHECVILVERAYFRNEDILNVDTKCELLNL